MSADDPRDDDRAEEPTDAREADAAEETREETREEAREEAPEEKREVPPPRRERRGRNLVRLIVAWIILIPLLLFVIWSAIALNYTYSSGERAGYVQKISEKGWLCKTWEGELAMANLPGTMPQIFKFSVRDDSIAHEIEQTLGKRVSLHYDQHPGVPSCFGETDYFVNRVRATE